MSSTTPIAAAVPLEGIQRVAVIGAGISGVCTAAHLLRQDLEVTLFERSAVPGGVWHFDPRPAHEPPYPNEIPSRGDYTTSAPGQHAYSTPPPGSWELKRGPKARDEDEVSKLYSAAEVRHAPPGPAYEGLKNNVSTRLMTSVLAEFPQGTEDFVSHKVLDDYIQKLSKDTGVHDVTFYNTRVESVRKHLGTKKWLLRTLSLEQTLRGPRQRERNWVFDAVVVASGHYNMPKIPDIPGLRELKIKYPSRVMHSKSYRNPEPFRNKTLFLIGAGVSSWDISREAHGKAVKTLQSSRSGPYDLPISLLPESTTRVSEVAGFIARGPNDMVAALRPQDPLPMDIILQDGAMVSGVHQVIMCTGYITSYPFLRQLHSDTQSVDEADDEVLVTRDGAMVHNLHADIFYIPDPTLAFVGVPYHVATFSLFDIQAQVVARVFAGGVGLPSPTQMRSEYEIRVQIKGLGRGFHSLRDEGAEIAYATSLRAWVNEWMDAQGGDRIEEYTDAWLAAHSEQKARLKILGRLKNSDLPF